MIEYSFVARLISKLCIATTIRHNLLLHYVHAFHLRSLIVKGKIASFTCIYLREDIVSLQYSPIFITFTTIMDISKMYKCLKLGPTN